MSDSHGRSLVLKLDDAAGALQAFPSGVVRKVSGLPGKTDRPNTDAAGDDAQHYEARGKSDGGPVSISGIWREQAGTKRHGRQARLLSDIYALSGKLRSWSLSRAIDLPDTDACGDVWKRRELTGKKSGSFSIGLKLDPAAGLSDPVLWAMLQADTPAVVSAAPGGFAIGNLVEMLTPYESSYTGEADHATGPNMVNAEFLPDGVIDLGVALHDLTLENGAAPVNFASVDEVAQTVLGWVAHLHVTAGTVTTVTIKIQDSADNSVWADLTGGTFAAVTTSTNVQRLVGASNATVRRYVRAIISAATYTNITFAVAFARRGSTYGLPGTYRHLYELYGHANTQTFEYGPEGSTAGKLKYSGEGRLSKMDTSIDHASGPVEFSAELMVDGAVVPATF